MNLTSIISVLEILIGIVAFLVPSIGINGSVATALIGLGLSSLGISEKIQTSNQVAGAKGVW
jgi:hypothetical protein